MEVTDLGLRREAEKAWDFWVTDNFDVYEIGEHSSRRRGSCAEKGKGYFHSKLH